MPCWRVLGLISDVSRRVAGVSEKNHMPVTPLEVSAYSFHENFIAHVRAGFTRAEALEIVLTIVLESMRLNFEPGRQQEED